MKQTIEIEVPDGKKAIWKDGKIVFEDIKPKLPKTWEEFCEHNKVNINVPRGHLALMQLHQLRDCYRQSWTPDWKNSSKKYSITRVYDFIDNKIKLKIDEYIHTTLFLTFPTLEIAREFLNNFKDLIEQAGDLI